MNQEKEIKKIISAEKEKNIELAEKYFISLAEAKRIKIKIDQDKNIFMQRAEIKIDIIFDSARYSRKY